MNPLVVIGSFLLGAGAGALLTAIVYAARIHQLKVDRRAGKETDDRRIA